MYYNIQIQNTANVGFTGIKCCVYGRAGMGKTFLCSTAPNPFIISAESGLLSLRAFQLPYFAVYNLQAFQEITRWVFGSNEARQFATFCIDSGTEIAEQILGVEKAKTRHGQQAYGAMIDAFVAELRKYRDLQGPNIYMSFKQGVDRDQSGFAFNRPELPGKQLPGALPYFPDELFQIGVSKDANNQDIHWLRTRPDAQNEAKDRSGRLNEYEPANLTYVFDKILGKVA